MGPRRGAHLSQGFPVPEEEHIQEIGIRPDDPGPSRPDERVRQESEIPHVRAEEDRPPVKSRLEDVVPPHSMRLPPTKAASDRA